MGSGLCRLACCTCSLSTRRGLFIALDACDVTVLKGGLPIDRHCARFEPQSRARAQWKMLLRGERDTEICTLRRHTRKYVVMHRACGDCHTQNFGRRLSLFGCSSATICFIGRANHMSLILTGFGKHFLHSIHI